MAEFPLDPMLSKMLLASETYGVSDQVRRGVDGEAIVGEQFPIMGALSLVGIHI